MRLAAHEQVGAVYLAHRHTLAALYGASVRTNVFLARARDYSSARAAVLFDDAIPAAVYDGLLAAVREAAPITERYLDLRRQALGLEQLAMYDLFVPLVPASERPYTYQEAVDLVLEALHPLGERYVTDLAGGLRGGWVDVHERRGKRGGAYAWGVYRKPPASCSIGTARFPMSMGWPMRRAMPCTASPPMPPSPTRRRATRS